MNNFVTFLREPTEHSHALVGLDDGTVLIVTDEGFAFYRDHLLQRKPTVVPHDWRVVNVPLWGEIEARDFDPDAPLSLEAVDFRVVEVRLRRYTTDLADPPWRAVSVEAGFSPETQEWYVRDEPDGR